MVQDVSRGKKKGKCSKYVSGILLPSKNTSKWEGKEREGKSTPQIFMLVQGAQPGMDAQEIFYKSHQALGFFARQQMRVKLLWFLLNSQCNDAK